MVIRGSAKTGELPPDPGVDRLRRFDHGFDHQLDDASLGASEQKSTPFAPSHLKPQTPNKSPSVQTITVPPVLRGTAGASTERWFARLPS
jgi:hypothetical protein